MPTDSRALATPDADSEKRTAWNVLAPALFVVMWSSGAIATPFGLSQVSPQAFLAVRAVGSAAAGWVIWTLIRDQLPTTRRQWVRTVLVAVLTQFAYQGCFFVALDRGITPGLLALIVSAQPLLTAVLMQTRSPWVWTALVFGLGGVTIAASSELSTGSNTVAGIGLAAGALAAITVGVVVQSRAGTEVGLWAALAVQSTFSAVMFTAATALLGVGRWQPGLAFVESAAWMVLVVSIGATALLYAMVRSRDNISVTGLFFTVPAVTAILDLLVNGTKLAFPVLLGMLLTIGALWIIQRRTRGT
ncbi:DMT family transporter [Nocardia sp. NPDC051321]|uniref:DMT family transporter n=1 Tax=Nocardia sp. NPDC051321 TaxID=3364323 RepID=UPI00379AE9AE